MASKAFERKIRGGKIPSHEKNKREYCYCLKQVACENGRNREKAAKLISGSGGLVTALAPVLRDRGGVWIGWDGNTGKQSHTKLFKNKSLEIGYSLKPLALSDQEVTRYYEGFSNGTVWPLFHDFLSVANLIKTIGICTVPLIKSLPRL